MTDHIDRRSALRLIGAAAAAGLAGCAENQNGGEPGNETEVTSTTDEPDTSTGDGQSLEVTEVDVDVDGQLSLRGALDDELLIIGRQDVADIVNYGGESDQPLYEVDEFVPVDDGVAYKAMDEVEDNGRTTLESVIISGGEELFRKSDGEAPQFNDLQVYDSLEGEAIWVDRKDQPGTIMHGEEAIETAYDEVRSVTVIGDAIGYIGVEDRDGFAYADAIKVGEETVADLDGFAAALTDIDGQPAYIGSTNDGKTVVFDGQQIGNDYTRRGDGRFEDVFELDGKLGFIANVASDRMENPERDREEVLWYDGEEIARHDRINAPKNTEVGTSLTGSRLTRVDGDLCYVFTDEQGTSSTDEAVYGGVMKGGELFEYGNNPSLVIDVEGTPAYRVNTEEGDVVVYGDQQTEAFAEDGIGGPIEADGTLYVQAEVDGEEKVLQVQ